MGSFLAVVGFLGFIVFIIMSIVSALRKSGKGKKRLLYAVGCFVIMIIGGAISPDAKETATTPTKVEKKETTKQSSAETAKKKVEDQKKSEEEAKKKAEADAKKKAEAEAKKKADEEAAAKKKAEEDAKKAQQETPQYKLEKAVTKALGEKSNREGKKITTLTIDGAGNIVLKFKGDENLTNNLTITGVQLDITDSLKAIQKSQVPFTTVNVITTYSMVDKYGNAEEDEVINLTYNKATVDKINFDNFDRKNIYAVADIVQLVHPEFVPKK